METKDELALTQMRKSLERLASFPKVIVYDCSVQCMCFCSVRGLTFSSLMSWFVFVEIWR